MDCVLPDLSMFFQEKRLKRRKLTQKDLNKQQQKLGDTVKSEMKRCLFSWVREDYSWLLFNTSKHLANTKLDAYETLEIL